MTALPVIRMSLAEYLAAEAVAVEKSEWVNGEIVAMSGASPRHGDVTARLAAIFGRQAWPRGCRVALADQRVRIDETGAYVYPDLVMTCAEPRYEGPRPLSLVNPQLIVEVASRTTRGFDEGWKWDHYRRMPSLRAYVLVDHVARAITVYAKEADGAWRVTDATEGDATIADLDLVLPLAEVFAGLDGYPDDAATGVP